MKLGNPNKMVKLKRYNLNFTSALEYFSDNLKHVNTLSDFFLKEIDFSQGSFFTLLTENSNIEKIYKFEEGGILPQKSPTKYCGTEETFTLISSIKDELSVLISEKINTNKNMICIFDDVSREASDPGLEVFYQRNSLLKLKKEIYYLLTKENNSIEFTIQLMLQSFTFWHTFGFIAEAGSLLKNNDFLAEQLLESICKEVQLAFLGAYDGEGYIFWEPKKTSPSLPVDEG